MNKSINSDILNSILELFKEKILSLFQQEKTYDELIALVNNNKLIPGCKYVLSDYTTKYKQPGSNVIKESTVIEKLVLTAISTNQFSTECSSLSYPQDIVYYDINSKLCEDNITPRKGFILRRNDTVLKINVPNDWRNILWARYSVDPDNYYIDSTLTPYSIWTSGAAVKGKLYKNTNGICLAVNNNIPTSDTDSNVFRSIVALDSYIFTGITNMAVLKTGSGIVSLKSSTVYNEYPTFKALFQNVYIGDSLIVTLTNNVFLSANANASRNVTLGMLCYNNTFKAACANVQVGNNFIGNILLNLFNNNIIGNAFNLNFINGSFTNNIIGNVCSNNIIGTNVTSGAFSNNIIGNAVNYNTILLSTTMNFSYNRLDNSIYMNNIFGGKFLDNIISSTFSTNTIESDFINNETGANTYDNNFIGAINCNKFGVDMHDNIFNGTTSYNSLMNYDGNESGNEFNRNIIHTAYGNKFGDNCSNNIIETICNSNLFGNNKKQLHIKSLELIDLSLSTGLENLTYDVDIQKRSDGNYISTYFDKDGNILLIPLSKIV